MWAAMNRYSRIRIVLISLYIILFYKAFNSMNISLQNNFTQQKFISNIQKKKICPTKCNSFLFRQVPYITNLISEAQMCPKATRAFQPVLKIYDAWFPQNAGTAASLHRDAVEIVCDKLTACADERVCCGQDNVFIN